MRALGFAVALSSLVFCSASSLAKGAVGSAVESADMAKARAALKRHHGNQINSLVLGERLEYQSNDGESLVVWETQGWVGGDVQKLWLKTEGEVLVSGSVFEEAEFQALYSRAISSFWDVQIGLRHDIKPARTHAAFGFQGLAPYWFELDGALFLSDQGDFSLRLEAEYDVRITQRLLLQPRLELNHAFSDDEASATGSGLASLQTGLRLRYEVRREFAPYIGFTWGRYFGKTRDLLESEGKTTNQLSFVAGLRFWF